jgi:hypothetical protein
MSRIDVEPSTLAETADRLRTAALDARRVCRALREAGPDVTGSAPLTAALREHADAWGWCLDAAHERVRTAARALHGAAAAYDRVERAIRDAAG